MQVKDQKYVITFRARGTKGRGGVIRTQEPGSLVERNPGDGNISQWKLEPQRGAVTLALFPVGSSHWLNLTRSQWTREPGKCNFQGADATQSRTGEGQRLDLSPNRQMTSTTWEKKRQETHNPLW